ncbi:MAG TPA: hypothetical protein VMQ81_10835 [Acidimicrobiia bacterium]|nr:hypothetical protein [Acidimicrobiia bacterium]
MLTDMLALATLVAFLTSATVLALIVRHHTGDDFGPSMRDFAAFRVELAAVGRRDQARV